MGAFLPLETFLYTVFAGFVGAGIYGLLLGQREAKIRGYLASKQHGWVRKRHVKAYVTAVRGYAVALDTRILGMLLLIIPFATAAIFWAEASSFTQDLDSLANRAVEFEQGRSPTPESLLAELRESRAKVDALRTQAKPFIIGLRVVSILTYFVFLYGLWFWLPLATKRRQLAYEIDRFTLRIQGLASKAELADLAVAESNVADEESLRAFVRLAGVIAARHEVPQLVARFDLWAEPNALPHKGRSC